MRRVRSPLGRAGKKGCEGQAKTGIRQMNVIWLVNIKTDIGLEAYYAGAESQTDALLMAAKHGYTGDAVNVK